MGVAWAGLEWTEFASDRALAAQALVQVGLCYEKLGRDEAVRAYERLVRECADQEDAVEQMVVARMCVCESHQGKWLTVASSWMPSCQRVRL